MAHTADWAQNLCQYTQHKCSRKIGQFSGRFKIRNRAWSDPVWPSVRGTSSARPTKHIEQNILDYLKRKDSSVIRAQGKGLTIDLATNNDTIKTTRPCNTCTPLLKKQVPLATIVFKDDGVIVRQSVGHLDSALALPSFGTKLRANSKS